MTTTRTRKQPDPAQQELVVSVKIEDVGPHKSLTLHLSPGVNLLDGPNGSGKTEATKAIVAAFGGSAEVDPRDGQDRGRVYVNGALVLKVGGVRKTQGKSTATLELVGYSALSDVVEPGIKDPVRADAARIRAILSMVPVPVTAQVVAHLADGEQSLFPLGCTHVLDVAEAIRRKGNDFALASEQEASKALGAHGALTAQLSSIPEGEAIPLPLEPARKEAAQARKHADQLALLADQRREAEARHARIEATLGQPPDVTGPTQAHVAALEDEKIVASKVQDAESAVIHAQLALKSALDAQARAMLDTVNAGKAKTAAEEAHRAWEKQRDALAEPITGPVAEDVADAEATADRAAKRLQAAEAHANRTKLVTDLGAALVAHNSNAERASYLRRLVKGVSKRLGELLADAGAAGLTVEDGRLLCEIEPGKWVSFADRLSEGQKLRKALAIGLPSFKDGLVPIDPHFYNSALQPSGRAQLHKDAVELGLYVVTERASDAAHLTMMRGDDEKR